MQSCSSYSKMSTLEFEYWPTTGHPPKNRPDGWIRWPLLNKSCCTSTRTRFSPHWIATLLGVTGCLNWKSTATLLCTSGTMGNLQSKGFTGPCNTCFSWRPRGSCANPLESRSWNWETFCKVFQNPWEERGPLEAGSDCGFMLLGLWLYLKLPHAFFTSNAKITTSTNTPCKKPILTSIDTIPRCPPILVFAIKYSFEFRWLLPFQLNWLPLILLWTCRVYALANENVLKCH